MRSFDLPGNLESVYKDQQLCMMCREIEGRGKQNFSTEERTALEAEEALDRAVRCLSGIEHSDESC